jgi:hypothetical protein
MRLCFGFPVHLLSQWGIWIRISSLQHLLVNNNASVSNGHNLHTAQFIIVKDTTCFKVAGYRWLHMQHGMLSVSSSESVSSKLSSTTNGPCASKMRPDVDGLSSSIIFCVSLLSFNFCFLMFWFTILPFLFVELFFLFIPDFALPFDCSLNSLIFRKFSSSVIVLPLVTW